MKYIMYWSIDPQNLDAALEKLQKIVPDESGRYPKKMSESYSLAGELNGFRLVEASEEQLRNLMAETIPEVQFSYVPIFEFPKIAKTYSESQK
ncbi:hypothetical protein GF326_05750 [Candidatus Bathyarchaeota archaeon]|nr:hypothetical protein [Candidatus Bathyarchaeota archaeon]